MLIEAIVIVLAVSFLSLGLHTAPAAHRHLARAWWSAITIPLVLAITFVTMYYWGVGLHKISLGSLIIALGLLVDDAIIVVEMMVRKLEEGYDKAARRHLRLRRDRDADAHRHADHGRRLPADRPGASPVTGEYTFAIFAVTAAALLISWVVSVYFVPYLGYRLLRTRSQPRPTARPHELFDTPFYSRFRAHRELVRAAPLDHDRPDAWPASRSASPAWAGCSSSSSPIPAGPRSWSTCGCPRARRSQQTERGRAALRGAHDARARHGTASRPGSAAACRASTCRWTTSSRRPTSARSILLPKDLDEREALRLRLPALLAQEFPEVRGRVKLLPNGPPVAYPVQFRVVGPDAAAVRAWADQAKAMLRANPSMRGVNDNWNESVKVLRLDIDQDKARALGVTQPGVAQASRTILSGTTIGQYREGDKLIDIVLRQPPDERDAITDLGNAYLPTASGRAVPLAQIAKIDFDWEPGVLWREGRDYAVTVQGDVVEGVQGPTVTRRSCGPQLQALAAGMPPGYAHRGRRRGRGEQQGPGLDRRRRAADAVHHLHAADAAAAELQPRDAGVPDRAAGHRRRGRGAAAAGPALRLRRAARA